MLTIDSESVFKWEKRVDGIIKKIQEKRQHLVKINTTVSLQIITQKNNKP